jgi:uncharacterized protein YfbU (UPF0304 family)
MYNILIIRMLTIYSHQDFQKIITNWQSVAKSYGISTSEIEQVKRAFAIAYKF